MVTIVKVDLVLNVVSTDIEVVQTVKLLKHLWYIDQHVIANVEGSKFLEIHNVRRDVPNLVGVEPNAL